jgi:hypothetical protein
MLQCEISPTPPKAVKAVQRSCGVQLARLTLKRNREAFMNKIAKLGALLGLVALGGCADPYGNYETSYYGGYGAGPYDNGPVRYDNYYGPDYYADRPYYGGGGGYRAYNPGRHDGGYRRGDRDGNRDAYRGANRDPNRDSSRDGRRDARPDGQASQRPAQRPQQQAQPQWEPQPGVSARTQIFGGGGTAAPQAAPSAPASSGWNGFQGRNPNDPNNTD